MSLYPISAVRTSPVVVAAAAAGDPRSNHCKSLYVFFRQGRPMRRCRNEGERERAREIAMVASGEPTKAAMAFLLSSRDDPIEAREEKDKGDIHI